MTWSRIVSEACAVYYASVIFKARLIAVCNLTLLKFELLPTELARFIGQKINCLIPYILQAPTHMPGVVSRLIAAIALCVLLAWLQFFPRFLLYSFVTRFLFWQTKGVWMRFLRVKVLENTKIRKNREGPEMKRHRVNACLFDAIRHPCWLFHDSSYFLLPCQSEKAIDKGKGGDSDPCFPPRLTPSFLCARYLFSLSLPPAGRPR